MATLTIADLDNGKRDLQTVDAVANSRAATATTRFGQQTTTLYEAIRRINATGDEILSNLGFRVPVPYASGLNVTDSRFTVTGPDGKVYAPLSAPFTTGAWDHSQWYVLQNDLNDHKLLIFDSFLSAQAAAAVLPDDQPLESPDSSGRQSRYDVQNGVLNFLYYTDTALSGDFIDEESQWEPVPKISAKNDAVANAQATALYQRTEHLNEKIAYTATSEANSVKAGIRNRSSARFLNCPPTTNNGGELLTMQSFWINPFLNEIWLGYDNNDRTRQVIERRKYNGTVVTSDVYSGANSVGHLDGFHVESDGSVLCTDKFTNPSVVRVKAGTVNFRWTYSVPTQGNQILAVDRSNNDRFIICTKNPEGDTRIFFGNFSEASGTVLNITDTGIEVDQTATIQGVAILYDRVYMLTGDGGLFTDKFLWEWRLVDGSLIAKVPHNPNRLYANTDYAANSREPEGLNVLFEGLHNEQQVQIYTGVLFADFGAGVAHNVIFKNSPALPRSNTPVFDGVVCRADGAEQFRPVQHSILFRKTAGVWETWSGQFESLLSRSIVTRVAAGGASNKGLVFDLANSYQAILDVSVSYSAGLRQLAGVELFWVEKAGGSTSRLNQKINFLRVADNVYLDADDSSLPNGSWISLRLTVVM